MKGAVRMLADNYRFTQNDPRPFSFITGWSLFHTRRFKRWVLCGSLLALWWPGLLFTESFAQTVGGTILGTIKDENGAAIPNAQVNLKNMATGVAKTVITNDEGFYRALNLHPGVYESTVGATGFSTQVRREITLNVGGECCSTSHWIPATSASEWKSPGKAAGWNSPLRR
jgi:hypothetical protein